MQSAAEMTAFRDGADNRMSVIPCRVSSGPHEWYNNLTTVLTRDSVKLQVA